MSESQEDRDREIRDKKANNLNVFMENGPSLSTKMETWIIGKDTKCEAVLEEGFGAMGVGRMWNGMTDEHRNDPRFDDVPEIECKHPFFINKARDR